MFFCCFFRFKSVHVRLHLELGDIPVLSLHRDKNPTSRSDISIAFARYIIVFSENRWYGSLN